MSFNIKELKEEIRDTLRLYMYPECTSGTIDDAMVNGSTLNVSYAQSFIPFSTCKDSIMVVSVNLTKYGTPDNGLRLSVLEDNDGTPSSSLATSIIDASEVGTSVTEISKTLTFSDKLISKNQHWIEIVPLNSPSLANYYAVRRDSVDTHYLIGSGYSKATGSTWSPLSTDIVFDCSISHWIYTAFPRIDLTLDSYPRAAIDIIGKPRLEQRWIDHRHCYYHVRCKVSAYSQYQDELDDIITYVDRSLFRERINTNYRLINTGDIPQTTVVRDNIFTKALYFDAVYYKSEA